MKQSALWAGRYLVWFSCGAASAVAAKLAIEKYGDKVEVLYCNTLASEHEDNARFMSDVSIWINKPIKIISSDIYTSIDDVFMKTKYMSGINGARCTTEMKKLPREAYQDVADIHIFGLTADEGKRMDDFEKNNPSLFVEWILQDGGIKKEDCYQIIKDAGISLPAMYALGFNNNNCKACVKATSPTYWNRTRQHFPDVFEKRCQQSRALGVRLVRLKGQRIFLDELPVSVEDSTSEGDIECGVGCQTPQAA